MTHATKTRTGTLDDIAPDSHVFSIIAMDQRNTLRRMFTAVGLRRERRRPAHRESRRRPRPDPRRQRPAVRPDLRRPAITEAGALAPGCGLLVAAEPVRAAHLPGRAAHPPRPGPGRPVGPGPGRRRPQVLRPAPRRPPGPRPRRAGPRRRGAGRLRRDHPRLPRHGCPGGDREPRVRAARGRSSGPGPRRRHHRVGPGPQRPGHRPAQAGIPGSPEGCRRLAGILDRPWAVLSAGVPFDQFTDIIQIAAEEGGASGFIAGRSVWREVVSLTGQQRQEFLTSVALPRLERLITVAERSARPWTQITSQLS